MSTSIRGERSDHDGELGYPGLKGGVVGAYNFGDGLDAL